MNKNVLRVLLFLLIVGGVFAFIYFKRNATLPEVERAKAYVKRELVNAQGLIESYPYRASAIPGNPGYKREALSESAGLWLWVLELAEAKQDFEESVGILKKYFLLSNGTLSWRIEIKNLNQNIPDSHNATVDDLRVIRILLEKGKEWQKKDYSDFASSIALALKEHAVYQDFLLHQAILKNIAEEPKLVILSYLDLKTMAMLAESDREWKAVYEQSLALLIKGMRPNGFFYDRYDISKNLYYDEEKNMINQLLCAIYLAEVGVSGNTFLEFLREEWQKKGRIYGRYDPETRMPSVDFENIAVYSLIMRLAWVMKDFSFAKEIKDRIHQLAATQKEVLWKDSLCDGPCHAFDHLQALLSFIMSEK